MAGADPNSHPPNPPELPPAGDLGPTPEPVPFNPAALLARLWQQNLPALRDRVDTLDQAAREAAAGALTAQTRDSAGDMAHKLAGSLGMFGYARGTDLAREFEQALEGDTPPDAALLLHLAAELRATLPL